VSRLLLAGLALALGSCAQGKPWMADESDRIDRALSAPRLAPEDDPALAGLALGPEAPALAPLGNKPGYAITPPRERRPTRPGKAASSAGRARSPRR